SSASAAWRASLAASSARVCSRRASSATARSRSVGFALSRSCLRRKGGGRRRRDAHLLADLRLDLRGELGMLLQVFAGVVLALADAVLLVREPGAGLLDHAVHDAELEDLAFARDALAVEDVEHRLAERRRDLVLHHLHPGLVADRFLGLLDGADAADVEPHRGVELERVAAG